MTQEKYSGEERRALILQQLAGTKKAISATKLAHEYDVSRQIIVGDIALLRAAGRAILATARGYLMDEPSDDFIGLVACLHQPEEAVQELKLIVEVGARIVDVRVDHPLYGELVGQLGIETEQDITLFEEAVAEQDTQLLSVLTKGVHLHTLACTNQAQYEEVVARLAAAGWLYQEKE